MPKQSYNWLTNLFDFLKREVNKRGLQYLIAYALKKLFGAAIGGIKGFLISSFITKIWNRNIKPAIDKVFRKMNKKVRLKKYEEIVEDAKKAENMEDFDSTTRDLP